MNKIVHLITTLERGGAEKQLLVLVREQLKLGYEVEIYPLKGQVELKNDFENLGAVVNCDLLQQTFFKQIIFLKKNLSLTDSYIHAHLPKSELLSAFSFPKGSFVTTRHNSEEFWPRKPKLISILLSRFVSNKSAATIAISASVRKYLFKNFEISKKKEVPVVYYGYESAKTVSKKRKQRDLFIAGTIARVVPQKDYVTLLHSFQYASQRIPNLELQIVGTGYLESEMKKICIKLGIQDKVIWLGRISDVDTFLKNLDLFILTSEYEGFGLVLLEALAANLPILATNTSAIPEVLGSKYDGLCEKGNIVDFGSKLTELALGNMKLTLLNQLDDRLQIFEPYLMSKKIETIYKEKIYVSN